MSFRVELAGRARIPITAVGLGDAEQQVEKLVGRCWPECRLDVLEVCRLGDVPRIADDYLVTCRIRIAETIDAESIAAARRILLLRARERFAGTALDATTWEFPTMAPMISKELQEGKS